MPRRHRPAPLVSLLALTFLGAPPALAETPEPLSLGLTVSGGVSLGSYEAGYLYYLSLLFKLNPGHLQPQIFTGASAGSVNALLALMASCSPPDFRATENLFFRSWVPVGLDELFSPRNATPISAFTREAGAKTLERVGQAWAQGLDARCDAVLGLSVTRVTATPVEVTSRVKVPRTEAKFVLRVQGRGPGKPPSLVNYVGAFNELARPLLPEEADGLVSFGALGQALEASTAFPLAFSPRPVTYCPSVRRGEDLQRCTRASAVTSLFYDGGVFDNQPLRLAVQLAARGLLPGEFPAFRLAPDVTRHGLPPRSRFLYLDPDTEVLPELSDVQAPPMTGAIPYALYLLGELIGSARSAELQALLDDSPEAKQQLDATLTYFRPLSGVLLNFFGFFDTEVRVHDFFLGMHDAAQFSQGWTPSLGSAASLWRPEEALEKLPATVRDTWRPFLCMRAVFDGAGEKGACEGLPFNFRAGAQTTVDKLFARCDQALTRAIARGVPAPATSHASCQAAIAGRSPPVVPGVAEVPGWRYREGESDLDYQLRRMQEHGYRFDDLGLEAGESPRRSVARQFNLIASAVGRRDLLVASAGRSYAQSIEYVPPDHTLSLLLGPAVEVAYTFSRGEGRASWARLHLSLGVEGLLSLLGPTPGRYLNLSPQVGVEFEATPLSGAIFQWRGGVRAGFQLSTADRFAQVGCTEALPCSRVVTEVYVAGTVVQWARLQLGVEILPPMRGLPFDARFKPSLGVEIDWP
jgi:predicted acylesterase/phospholipase RssA